LYAFHIVVCWIWLTHAPRNVIFFLSSDFF
jgi:hypothetical protein